MAVNKKVRKNPKGNSKFNDNTSINDVAIIGISCRFPGAKDHEKFWEIIEKGVSQVSGIPSSRPDLLEFLQGYQEDEIRSCLSWGSFLEDIDTFDHSFFGISPREAKLMDPQQRIMLELTWECLEDARIIPAELAGKQVSVFIGACNYDYKELLEKHAYPIEGYNLTGNQGTIIPNRMSHIFKLHGPSVVVDTACSSSLAALHWAMMSIQTGESRLALVGGINLLFSPLKYVSLAKLGVLSKTGGCKTFDASADGYTRGEGAGLILLKPLASAIKDNNRIYGVIKATGMNHGGTARSLTSPNVYAQSRLLIDTYKNAGISPTELSYIETHGTGTPLGDPIEIIGLKRSFRKLLEDFNVKTEKHNYCGLGSVKTNIGHLEPAAGIAGVIKTVMAMRHRTIPALQNFSHLNPKIKLTHSPFYIASENKYWDPLIDDNGKAIPRRAGVSSFGFGGTNVHVILEEWAAAWDTRKTKKQAAPGAQGVKKEELVTLSAKNEERLNTYALKIRDWLGKIITVENYEDAEITLEDIAYTLHMGREPMEERLAILAENREKLLEYLKQYCDGIPTTKNIYRGNSGSGPGKSVINRLLRERDLKALAKQWVKGAAIDWQALYPMQVPKHIPLPTYPFEKKHFWIVHPGDYQPTPPEANKESRHFGQFSAGAQKEGQARKKIILKNPGNPDNLWAPSFSSPPGRSAQQLPTVDHETVKKKVAQELANILFMNPDEIDERKTLIELGLDSVLGVEFIKKLNEAFQVDIRASKLYDYSNVSALADYIISIIPTKPARGEFTSDKPIPVEPAREEPIAAKPAPMDEIEPPKQEQDRAKVCSSDIKRDIAVIGISARFPGAKNIKEFWKNLQQGKCAITEIPAERWDINEYYDPQPGVPGKSYCKWGGFLTDVDRFDSLFFNIPPAEAEIIDPQQRLILEEAWRALEDAGYTIQRLNNTKCGVYVGIMGSDQYAPAVFSIHSFLPARIAYFLNLKGPAILVDTACSSSLVAMHWACKSLINGEADLMLAGGVTLYLTEKPYIGMSKIGMLSPTGLCKTFDDEADGFVPGEGAAVVVLKLLEKATFDGDHIYGVIKGSGLNQDGKTNGITAPSAEAQTNLEVEVYQASHINPGTITYVEAHGTGTKLGDPIEIDALTEAFAQFTQKKQYCHIGSVKTNIGHTSAAAGAASVIKVLLAMQHKEIPPSLHFYKENQHIRLADTPFIVNTQLKPWGTIPHQPRRAAVSSFGASGTNAHLVLEEWQNNYPPAGYPAAGKNNNPYYLITVSAKSKEALEQKFTDLDHWLEEQGNEYALGDIAYTLHIHRTHFPLRAACLIRSIEDFKQKIKKIQQGETFPGCLSRHPETAPFEEEPILKEFGKHLIAELQDRTNPDEQSCKEKLTALADLYTKRYDLPWQELYKDKNYHCISLPTYPFAGERCWVKGDYLSTGTQKARDRGFFKLHPLLDHNTSTFLEERFTTRLLGNEFYLTHHLIDQQKVFPGTAYLEMARAAGELAGERRVAKIKSTVWAAPVVVANEPQNLHVCLYPDREEAEYEVITRDETETRHRENLVHVRGRLVYSDSHPRDACNAPVDIPALKKQCPHLKTGAEIYQLFRQQGLYYGPAFQCIRELAANRREALSYLDLPGNCYGEFHNFVLHPSLLDGAWQTAAGLMIKRNQQASTWYLPFSLGEVEIIKPLTGKCYAYVIASDDGIDQQQVGRFDIRLLDEEGEVMVKMLDFCIRPAKQNIMPQQHPFIKEESSTVIYLHSVWEPSQEEVNHGR